jgi:hypothetical protein
MGAACGGAGAAPTLGGATPTIVPFNLFAAGGGAAPVADGTALAGPGAGVGAAPAPGFAPGVGSVPGWFIMSIVPLNFGTAPPPAFNAVLHCAQVVAVSGLLDPQFGQNTKVTSTPSRSSTGKCCPAAGRIAKRAFESQQENEEK